MNSTVTPEKAAEMLECSVKKVYAMIHRGAIAAENRSLPGAGRKTYRIAVEEIAAYRERARGITQRQVEAFSYSSSPDVDGVIPFLAMHRKSSGGRNQ